MAASSYNLIEFKQLLSSTQKNVEKGEGAKEGQLPEGGRRHKSAKRRAMLIKYQQQQHRGKQVNAAAIKYIKKRDKVIQSVLHAVSTGMG